MFGKRKQEENRSISMTPNFQQDDLEVNQENPIYNQFQQQMPPIQQVQNQVQMPVQVQRQVQQPINQPRAVITKVELTENKTIKFEGEANHLVNIGDCQINQ